MPKGKKTCEACNREAGPRTKICPCGQRFTFKLQGKDVVKTKTIDDWKSLESGQVIKVIQGYGPYYINKEQERISLAYKGVFRVKFINNFGIGAYPLNGTEEGFCFIYMGKKRESVFGIDEPHKITLVKNSKSFA